MSELNRLTKKALGCFQFDLKDHEPVIGEFGTYEAFFDYSMAVKRLGEYEDAGLTPEEISELAEAKLQGNLILLPCNIGDKVYVDVRTLPCNYLHPLDGCRDFAKCEVIGFSKTKFGTFMKISALYPSRMHKRGYLRYSIGAIGKTVFYLNPEEEGERK